MSHSHNSQGRYVPQWPFVLLSLFGMVGAICLAAWGNWPNLAIAYRPGYDWIGWVTLVTMLVCLVAAVITFCRYSLWRLLGFIPLGIFLYPFAWLIWQHVLVHG